MINNVCGIKSFCSRINLFLSMYFILTQQSLSTTDFHSCWKPNLKIIALQVLNKKNKIFSGQQLANVLKFLLETVQMKIYFKLHTTEQVLEFKIYYFFIHLRFLYHNNGDNFHRSKTLNVIIKFQILWVLSTCIT